MATKNRTKGVPTKVVSEDEARRELRAKAKKRSSGRVRIPRYRPSSSVELEHFRLAEHRRNIKGLAMLLAVAHTASGESVPEAPLLITAAKAILEDIDAELPDLPPPTKEAIRQARIEDAKKAREARKGKGA